MARDGLRWIDSDMHLAEPWNLWEEYIEPDYRDAWQAWTGIPGPYNSLRTAPAVASYTERKSMMNVVKESRYADFAPYVEDDWINPSAQTKAMDIEGIDVAVLFPTVGNRGWRGAPPDVAAALARAYNDWVTDFAGADPTRLKVHALVPLADVDAAVLEVRRMAKRGAVSVEFANRGSDLLLGDERFEPIWNEVGECGMAVAFHESLLAIPARYGDTDGPYSHAPGRVTQHMYNFMELLFGGVLERHQEIRFAFLEAGCSWVPYWLFRLEEEWERYREVDSDLARNVRMKPSEYWARQCYAGVEVEEWTLPAVISTLGDENWVVSSDFPHFDSAFPHAFTTFLALKGVDLESKKKILYDNCTRLYRL